MMIPHVGKFARATCLGCGMNVQGVEHLIKEGAETVMRSVMRSGRGPAPEDVAKYVEQIHDQGYAVVERFWPADRCADVARNIETALTGENPCHHWADPEGADQRLYFAERLGGDFESYFNDLTINRIRKYYAGSAGGDQILMAARLGFVPGNKGSGGGWHRDSPHRSQFKAIMYLTDVGEENGPFQYMPRSHRSLSTVRLLLTKKCHPNQYRFEDADIEALKQQGEEVLTFTAPAGTLLLVDVKGIHRGMPIKVGQRCVLMKYFWDGARPQGFLAA